MKYFSKNFSKEEFRELFDLNNLDGLYYIVENITLDNYLLDLLIACIRLNMALETCENSSKGIIEQLYEKTKILLLLELDLID